MDITTKRLLLQPVTAAHVQDVFSNFNAEVTKYMIPVPARHIEETAEVVRQFERQRENDTNYVYAITIKSSGEFIGLVGLHHLQTAVPHLGIWTKLAAHGHHYGREAVGGVIEYARSLRITKLCYPVDRRNIASKKIPLFYGGIMVSKCNGVETQDGRILQIENYEIEIDLDKIIVN